MNNNEKKKRKRTGKRKHGMENSTDRQSKQGLNSHGDD